MTDDRLSWVHADGELAGRLAAVLPAWEDDGDSGLVAVLDQQSDWAGWESWSDDDRRSTLGRLLDAWHPPVDRLAWARDDADLVARLSVNWPAWEDPGDAGLAAVLDGQSDWAGWDGWGPDQQRQRLALALSEWYPVAEPEVEVEVDRLSWVRADGALVSRLDAVWPGWTEPDAAGLLGVLGSTAEWAGWEEWDGGTQREYLGRTLDAWYPPAEARPVSEELRSGLTDALAQAHASVPGAANLSDAELRDILSEVLTEELAALGTQP